MKKVLPVVLVVVMGLFCCFAGCSHYVIDDGFSNKEATQGLLYEKCRGGYKCIGMGKSSDKDVVIASTFKDKPVVGIDGDDFLDGYFGGSLESITIPSSVTFIEDGEFLARTPKIVFEDTNGWYAFDTIDTPGIDKRVEKYFTAEELATAENNAQWFIRFDDWQKK